MNLDPLPGADGAPMTCSLDVNVPVWPYVERCKGKAAGLLPEAEYQRLRESGVNLGGRMICAEHAAVIDREVSR